MLVDGRVPASRVDPRVAAASRLAVSAVNSANEPKSLTELVRGVFKIVTTQDDTKPDYRTLKKFCLALAPAVVSLRHGPR